MRRENASGDNVDADHEEERTEDCARDLVGLDIHGIKLSSPRKMAIQRNGRVRRGQEPATVALLSRTDGGLTMGFRAVSWSQFVAPGPSSSAGPSDRGLAVFTMPPAMTNHGRLGKDAPFFHSTRSAMSDPIILIPARLAATRLPNKPLADIGGEPMIVHVWRRAVEAGIGPVAVATDSREIADAVVRAGGVAVMTRADHPSGSDRIFEAVEKLDPEGRHDVVVNVQGDLPTIDPRAIASSILPLSRPGGRPRNPGGADPSRRRAHRPERREDGGLASVGDALRALYFTRATAPYGDGPLYHHIGLYAYRRKALQRFVSLPPSPLEMRESSNSFGLSRPACASTPTIVDDVPLGVDTPQDLERARSHARSPEKAMNQIISFQGELGANSHIACEEVHPDWTVAALADLRRCVRGGHRTGRPSLR